MSWKTVAWIVAVLAVGAIALTYLWPPLGAPPVRRLVRGIVTFVALVWLARRATRSHL